MSGYEDFVLVRERIPYSGKGIEPLLAMLHQILTANPRTQEFRVRIGEPIEITKFVPLDQVPERLTVHDAVRTRQMDEHVPRPTDNAQTILLEMFKLLDKEQLHPLFFLVGAQSKIFKWVDIPRRSRALCGVEIHKTDAIPDDVVVLSGARSRDGQPEDIELSIKVTMP